MPLYEIQCQKCGEVKCILVGAKDIAECGAIVKDTETAGECEKCGCHVFKRIPSAHGKMASWSNW